MEDPNQFWSLMTINGRELVREINKLSSEDIEVLLATVEAEKKERGFL